jgi:hypothetical protein
MLMLRATALVAFPSNSAAQNSPSASRTIPMALSRRRHEPQGLDPASNGSQGNLYLGEASTGRRVQKFALQRPGTWAGFCLRYAWI